MISIKCDNCEKKYLVYPYSLKKFNYHFCSIDCKNTFQKTHLELNNFDKNCHKSGKNSSHYGKFKSRILSVCNWCGKEFLHSNIRIRKFCSIQCFNNYERKNPNHNGFIDNCHGKLENHPNWLGGKSFESYGMEFNNKLKKRIRERDNYTCQECGILENELGYKLACHHIDYDKKNNSIDNLISLCKSCHAQTNWNRKDWTKYFNNKIGSIN